MRRSAVVQGDKMSDEKVAAYQSARDECMRLEKEARRLVRSVNETARYLQNDEWKRTGFET
jgi:hypothetical protein